LKIGGIRAMTTSKAFTSFQVSLPQILRFGVGVLDTLSNELVKMRVKKGLIVTDPGVFQSGLAQKVTEQFAKAGITVDVFTEVEPEPSFSSLNNAAQKYHKGNYDCLIGVGGGSSIDTAKGLSVLLAHGGKGQDYAGTDKIPGPGIALIAIPTTAGTGSETTNIAIFSDNEKDVKTGVVSNYLSARLALVDPVLTYSCPRGVTAASGIDALVHTIECYTSLKSNDFTDAISIKAMQLISGNLKTAVNDGSNKDARCAMAEGSMLAGIAFGNSGVAAVHALAYPLGARFHVSHGVANGLLLPYVMNYNLIAEPVRYAFIAETLGQPTKGLAPLEAAALGVTAVKDLIKGIGIPSRLRDLNVPEAALEGMALATMDITRLLANNPRPLTLDDVRHIWQDAW
jgi:alcohol dehydrogenase class IV